MFEPAATGRTAAVNVTTADRVNVECVVAERPRSELAQQSSACAWVTECLTPAESDLCIGQVLSCWQHTIRASGVACQPAHTARFPTLSARTAAAAASRRLNPITVVGCWRAASVSNRVRRTGGAMAVKDAPQPETG